MKFIFLICIFASSLMASAKTLEQGHTCFQLESQILNSEVPQKICFQTVKVMAPANDVVVVSYLQPELFMDSRLDLLTRRTEDEFLFTASNRILDNWDAGCMRGERQEIMISGRADNDGNSEAWSLTVSLDVTTTKDTCHAPEQTVTYKYK